ncbi:MULTISPECIES: PadR family transcriptional regulator [Brevibacillus]|uniref:PadR family transcriptional regulator n=1 Tax=Brevibacillus invocatus TaxID=173959 RepID=A0A3M8CGB9_9BACL|nr:MULTISPECIES: PadR family transcriptional regulator [Brevibacillus]MCM3078770.1 PadR family transcriptional regulator [Brevibacillus invocatus]MCM3428858.1 PadR family transcriptional regulator [Brevibacillus invocatus]MDH4616346.1 helix-turn-helix transcriptional regulator [Brevibacillus sp. AY1]RNB74543.1 PadR family transcriptional regulator [Brevibacillus invocatus]
MRDSNISSDLIRGHIDTIILRVLCEGDNYGYEIIKAISKISEGKYELKEPSLYSSLKRLETQKQIISYWGDESQGGRRKYYQVTPSGRDAYEQSLAAWKVARELIDQLLERKE